MIDSQKGRYWRVIESEKSFFPDSFRPFLDRTQPPSIDEQTLAYYAHGYSRAFEELAEVVLEYGPGRATYLRLPLTYLCRHSIELTLKKLIARISLASTAASGHSLLALWQTAIEDLSRMGAPQAEDEWLAHCEKLVAHIDGMDRNGEHFRYPSDKKGTKFPFTEIDVEGLVRGRWSIIMFCDAVETMMDDSRP